MAQAHFVKKAQKDIYENGKTRKYVSQKGKNKGHTLETLDRTIPENKKDKILIARGESYWWWQFKGSDKSYSKTEPKASQLTRSDYLATIYDLQDRLSNIRDNVSDVDSLQTEIEDIKSEIETLRDEQEEKKSNMPEGLQEGPTGELLQERYDALDNAYSELDSIDLDYDEPDEDELREEAIEELGLIPHTADDDDKEEGEEEDDDKEELNEHGFTDDEEKQIESRIDELKDEKFAEWRDEKCDELSNISFE